MHHSISRAHNPRAFLAKLTPWRRQFDAKRVRPSRRKRRIRLLTKWLFSQWLQTKNLAASCIHRSCHLESCLFMISITFTKVWGPDKSCKSSRINSGKLVATCFLTCRGNSFSHFLASSSCVDEVTNVSHFLETVELIEMDSFFFSII